MAKWYFVGFCVCLVVALGTFGYWITKPTPMPPPSEAAAKVLDLMEQDGWKLTVNSEIRNDKLSITDSGEVYYKGDGFSFTRFNTIISHNDKWHIRKKADEIRRKLEWERLK